MNEDGLLRSVTILASDAQVSGAEQTIASARERMNLS